MTAAKRLGVGIIGAGPVTQAIHLPTLARVPELFSVTCVMDVSADVAESVAARVGARAVTSVEDLLADPNVDVVAVCSPPQFHASQVIAAMEAGKKAVLCEKPFATTPEEAAQIAAASERTGVPVLVGAMHVFDEGWARTSSEWGDFVERAHTVTSRIVLPLNERFEDWATQIHSRPPAPEVPSELDAQLAGAFLYQVVLGLAVHDLPLIRTLLPDAADIEVRSAELVRPLGYVIDAVAGERDLHLHASIHAHWQTSWELEAIADDSVLTVAFTPSYVHAGSAVATLRRADGTSRTWGPFEANGYETEWQTLHAVANGDPNTAPSAEAFLADLEFILAVAERSSVRATEEFTA